MNPDFEFNFIPYAANFRFELYHKGKIFHVRTKYNGADFKFKKYCNNDKICPVSRWLRAMREVVYSDP